MRQPQPNKWGVQKHQWAKWMPEAQELFNRVYDMLGEVDLFANGGQNNSGFMQHFPTLRWNAAFMAACEMTDILKEDASEKLRRMVDAQGS